MKLFAEYCGSAQKILDVGVYHRNPYLVKDKSSKNRTIVGFDIRQSEVPLGYDSFVQGDVQSLHTYVGNERFDAIIIGEVIEHVKSPYDAIESCYKALNPGGVLIVSTPNPLGFPLIFFEYLSSEKFFYIESHAFSFIQRWFGRILYTAGFTIEKVVGIAWLLPMKIPAPLAYQLIYVARKVLASGYKNGKIYRSASNDERLG